MDPFREEEYLKSFGEHLRQLRKEKGMSQEELAARSNVTLSQIGRIERGKRAPTVLTIVKIAHGLEIEPGQLFRFHG